MANQEAQLLFKGEEIKQLDELLGNVPTKFGLPIVQLIQQIAQKRYNEAQEAESPSKSISADSTEDIIEVK